MYGIGKRTLEEGLNRGPRWMLGVCSGAIGVAMLVMAPEATRPEGHVLIGLFACAIAACCFLTGGARRLAGRVVGALVFAAAVLYLVVATGSVQEAASPRDWSTLGDAIAFFVLAGLPGLCFACLGKLRWRKPEREPES